ncbi:MAG: hypothetical protein H0T79_21470, partial [Deltaproteobacteria bacterium]|nr:hypothetical protein [Deltaproteobacteria bacterium]
MAFGSTFVFWEMIPNRAAWLALLGLGACQPDARYPGAFQGVIELDER